MDRNKPLIDPATAERLKQAVAAVRSGRNPDPSMLQALADLSRLSAQRAFAVEQTLRRDSGLGFSSVRVRLWPWRWFVRSQWRIEREREARAIRDSAAFARLALFHRDGRFREEALATLKSPLPSAFWVAALAARLNDWAGQVRAAAVKAAERLLPLTAAGPIAEAALELLPRVQTWRRWGDERTVLLQAFARPDVVEAIADRLTSSPQGKGAQTLSILLRDDGWDDRLEDMARDAVQPAVRALALRTLLERQARWRDGSRKEWIDRSMGRFRMVPLWSVRPAPTALPMMSLIDRGLSDRAASVRLVAADAFTRCFTQHAEHVPELVARLLADRSPSVRMRGAYLARRTQEGLDA